MTSLLAEKLSSARLIKTFRLERYAADRLNRSFEQVYRLRLKAVKNRARIDPMLEALGGVAVAGVIAFAYWRIASGVSTVGDFMGFVTALLMAPQPIRALGNSVGQGAGGARRRAERLCPPRREAAHRRPPRRAPARRHHRHHPLRERLLRLCGRQRHAGDHHFDLEIPAAKRWRSSAARERASRPSSTSCRGSSTSRRAHPRRRPGPARGHARLAARRHRDRQPGRDPLRRHDRCEHCARAPRRALRGDRGGRARCRRRTSSSSPSATATPPRSATAASVCPASASGWRSRAPSSRTRPSCCSTRRRARSIPNRSGSCRRRSPASPATARRSSSPPLDGAERRPHLRHGRGRIVELGTHAALMGRDGPTQLVRAQMIGAEAVESGLRHGGRRGAIGGAARRRRGGSPSSSRGSSVQFRGVVDRLDPLAELNPGGGVPQVALEEVVEDTGVGLPMWP